MVLDFTAYCSAQQRTSDLARQALPNAPVRPDPDRPRRTLPHFQVRLRLSSGLRRLADLVEPGPAEAAPRLAGGR